MRLGRSLTIYPLKTRDAMNQKNICAACVFAALNIGALSASAQDQVKPETYTYGTVLEVQEVLSLVEDVTSTCGVVNARMTYLDSAGQTQVLDYLKLSNSCLEGGS